MKTVANKNLNSHPFSWSDWKAFGNLVSSFIPLVAFKQAQFYLCPVTCNFNLMKRNENWLYDKEICDNLQSKSENKTEEEKHREWCYLTEKYKVGDEIKGVIFMKAPFGVFIDFGENYHALLEVIQIKNLDYQSYINNDCYKLKEDIICKCIYIDKETSI